MRRIALALIVSLGVVMAPAVPAHATAGVQPDPVGDVADARGDIVQIDASYLDNEIQLGVKVQQPVDPATSDNWKSPQTQLTLWVDTQFLGAGLQYLIEYEVSDSGALSASIYDFERVEVACSIAASFVDNTYRVTMAPACIGTPPGFYFTTRLVFDTVTTDTTTPRQTDSAPDNYTLAGPLLKGTPHTGGYNILTSFGGIYSFGTASYHKNLIDSGFPGPAVGLAETPDGGGYVIVTKSGALYTFGNAQYFGNLIDGHFPGEPAAVAMTPTGKGYAILTTTGGLYSFGDARTRYYGNLLDRGFPGVPVSMSFTPSGMGYAIMTAGGGVYTFGDAPFFGTLASGPYPGPATSIAYTKTQKGYYILNAGGGLYTFGDAPYLQNLIDRGYPGPAVELSVTP